MGIWLAKVGCGKLWTDMMTIFNRSSICWVFLVVSIITLIAIGFIATPPPERVPLFIVNAILVVPVIILGSKWQRVFGCILLIVVLYLAEEEHFAGKNGRGNNNLPTSSLIQK